MVYYVIQYLPQIDMNTCPVCIISNINILVSNKMYASFYDYAGHVLLWCVFSSYSL